MEKDLIIIYLVTGFITAFDVCFEFKKNDKDLDILDTGWILILSIFFWLPGFMLCTYGYALKFLWEIITEEEDDE